MVGCVMSAETWQVSAWKKPAYEVLLTGHRSFYYWTKAQNLSCGLVQSAWLLSAQMAPEQLARGPADLLF